MGAAAAELPPSRYPVAVIHRDGLAAGEQPASGDVVDVIPQLAGSGVVEERRVEPAVGPDHHAPPDTRIGVGQRFHHAHLLRQRHRWAAPRLRHRHPEHPGRLQRIDEVSRESASRGELVGSGLDLRQQGFDPTSDLGAIQRHELVRVHRHLRPPRHAALRPSSEPAACDPDTSTSAPKQKWRRYRCAHRGIGHDRSCLWHLPGVRTWPGQTCGDNNGPIPEVTPPGIPPVGQNCAGGSCAVRPAPPTRFPTTTSATTRTTPPRSPRPPGLRPGPPRHRSHTGELTAQRSTGMPLTDRANVASVSGDPGKRKAG